ncbi:hypothetical protein EDC01DRAFT_755465 [Geopyxis carbonaria]|nr:hypothetical protein EDC01DRAFT_755465 [Geopyxis carbonaria]
MKTPLHLYRHLIRHAHVLYDDLARAYISRYIRLRFESLREVKGYHQRKHLKEGRRGLSVLQRANSGVYPALTKILELTYGRTGRRRHELLKPIFEYPTENTEPLIPGVRRSAPPQIPKPLEALLQWNNKKGPVLPKIPETNNWGRPFPKCREANLRWRHLIATVKKCPAPLPLEEHSRLERLASGKETPLPMRRKVPLKVVIPERLTSNTLGRPRNMSPRAWRRHWSNILARSPALKYNDQKEIFQVVESDVVNMAWIRPLGNPEEFEGWQPKPTKQKGP